MGSRAQLLAAALAPLLSFLAGAAAGAAGLEPPERLGELLLYLLVAVAGLDIGLYLPQARGLLAGGAAAGLLLAASCIMGGALAGAGVALLLGDPPLLGAAVGAASGWYTLAAPVVAAVEPRLAATALLANQLREAMHIILYPFLARRGLGLPGLALGGATTMDTGLPVVMLHGGSGEVAAAIVQGAVLTLVLPALLPLLAGAR